VINPKYQGYWRRGRFQYWHIKENGALLINTAEPNAHYNGDAHIFFDENDSPANHHVGRCPITKEEFDQVKELHIKRLNEY